ncbi:Hypothetical protein R9X50_00569000 [Acrodontium crateriforme]|uniref:Uncharacterized protein n=1 Tax=Acrodontium crateriforme TaxID=150365 RepID=A0AAQ3MCU0_9PEZI|nr:Hypothetical protein R9X50_00569000 [Acrodontium crateriforme]
MQSVKNDRRERTFIGSSCAVCEEPLEHTLRGERILALSCSHVSHEACFYEYLKEFDTQACPVCDQPLSLDTSRGGGIDFDNLNKLVRAAQNQDARESYRDARAAPSVWDADTIRQSIRESERRTPSRASRDHLLPSSTRSPPDYGYMRSTGAHGRHQSADTGLASSTGWSESNNGHSRLHDYDVQSLESTLSSPRHTSRNPIPAPTVTVRSEFPTLNKSRTAQNLTCLVTVEIPDGKWRPSVDDFRKIGPVPAIPEEVYEDEKPKLCPSQPRSEEPTRETLQALEEAKQAFLKRMDAWHGLRTEDFGDLIQHGMIRVGKDKNSWQLLECYLFPTMLICAKERKPQANGNPSWDHVEGPAGTRKCTLKGAIQIARHLTDVQADPETHTLTLKLSVSELPLFNLQFFERSHFLKWQQAINDIYRRMNHGMQISDSDPDTSGTDEEEYNSSGSGALQRRSSIHSSSFGANRSQATAPTEYTNSRAGAPDIRLTKSTVHVPLDIVVAVPVSSSMQGLKISILRDSLRFLVASLGERDRMGLVTFGSGTGGVPLVSLTAKTWNGWARVLESIRPTGHKSVRADLVEGANVAMDLLMQRKSSNPLSNIIVISDAVNAEKESVDFVVSRAEAAKVPIHTFGLGMNHYPDTMVDLTRKTRGTYTYVKDWMQLRECLAGCLGSLQSTSHQNVKLKLRLPEGSTGQFLKISGALAWNKRATGRDAEALLGDLKFGDKRDVLVQLVIPPEASTTSDASPSDPWENVIAGLEALGGGTDDEESRSSSVEELPLLQGDLTWGDVLRDGAASQLPRPSLLTITVLPPNARKPMNGRASPPIPSHPSVVQRRMEMLTVDMLTRALSLVTKGENEKADRLLRETRSVINGLCKGSLPPLPLPPKQPLPPPPPAGSLPPTPPFPSTPTFKNSPKLGDLNMARMPPTSDHRRTPSPADRDSIPTTTSSPCSSMDLTTKNALDTELATAIEYIMHPDIFARDARKSVLQAISVIQGQRSYTHRTKTENLWADRNPGVNRNLEMSNSWRDPVENQDDLTEENWA